MVTPNSVEFTYTNKTPIALKDLTNAFTAISAEYQKVVKEKAATVEDTRIELYVKEIRKGSIIAELISLAQDPAVATAGVGAAALAENVNSVIDFCKHLKNGFDFLTNKGPAPAAEAMDKKSYENLQAMVGPVVKEVGSAFVINAPITAKQGNITFNVTINNGDAALVQKNARASLSMLKAPSIDTYDAVSLRLYQARNDKRSRSGNKAIISEIYDKPVKVVFANEDLKRIMPTSTRNPFLKTHKVDVAVDYAGEVPKLYRVIKVYQRQTKAEKPASTD